MAGNDTLSPAERVFMEAGYSRLYYLCWTLDRYPTMAAATRVHSGWPAESFDDEALELMLAKRWLAGNRREVAVDQRETAVERKPQESPAGAQEHLYGPLMSSREVLRLLEAEQASGHCTSPKAFENALRRAAKKARGNPDLLPLQLGGQHADWELVKLGAEAGGHGNVHLLRRRLPRSANQTPQTRRRSESRPESSLLRTNSTPFRQAPPIAVSTDCVVLDLSSPDCGCDWALRKDQA
jgi:hypothetical protein